MNKKRIVMLGPARVAKGGMATVINNYEKAGLLKKWGVIFLVTHAEGNTVEKVFVALHALCRFIALLITGRVALLHVHSAQNTSFWRKSLFSLIAFSARRPVLFHLHGSEFMDFYNLRCGRLRKQFVRFVLTKSAAVIGLSTQWVQNITVMAPDAHAVCLFNSVSVPVIDDARPQKDRQPIILFLGRLGLRKGTYDLLDALVAVRKEFPNVILKLGGDGDEGQVRERAKELGVERNIEILGWVTGDQKDSLLREAAVYVLPSYNEGLPMGILEAMSMGLPVVSTPVGGIPDAIASESDGILVDAGDVAALALALKRLLHNPNLRQELGDAAREKIIQRFSAKTVIPQLEKLYKELGATAERSH